MIITYSRQYSDDILPFPLLLSSFFFPHSSHCSKVQVGLSSLWKPCHMFIKDGRYDSEKNPKLNGTECYHLE